MHSPYSPDLALLSFPKTQDGIPGNENDIVMIRAKSWFMLEEFQMVHLMKFLNDHRTHCMKFQGD